MTFASCSRPSTEGDSLIGEGSTGVISLSQIEGINLIDPVSSPSTDPSPLISIIGVAASDTVSIFSDSTCSTFLTSEVSIGESVQITLPTLSLGSHRFYAKRSRDSVESDCSNLFLNYILEGISITGLSDDLVPAKNKSFSWGCSGAAACEYRFVINSSANHSFTTEAYTGSTTITESSGTGMFYIHLQARDTANLSIESGVYSYQFTLDNSGAIVISNTIVADVYGIGEVVKLLVNFDEIVIVSGTPRIQINFETESSTPTYALYTEGSGTEKLTFEYTVSSGDEDNNNITSMGSIDKNGGSLSDSLGNLSDYLLSSTTYSGTLIDGIPASITGVSITDSTYELGSTLSISVSYSETVNVSGLPKIELQFESQSGPTLFATLNSGTGTNTLKFNYIISSGDFDINGIDLVEMINLSGAVISDSAGNNANSNLITTNFSNVFVDSAAPYITSFIEPANGTYANGGGELLFQVNFSEPVNITGLPIISINLGGVNVSAVYKSGSGSSGLEFSYTVKVGDTDSDGITLNSSSINLDGGSIIAVSDSDPSALEFGAYLNSMSGVIVDTSGSITAPDQVTGVTTAPTTNNSELRVSWVAPSGNGSDIINYSVQYREQGTSTWKSLSSNPNRNYTNINALSAGLTYEIRVAANNGLLGPYSDVSNAQIFDVLLLNPIAWLSSTDITNGGSEPLNDDKIDQWQDLTGAASAATEANPASQPTYKTNVQNGLPGVRFDNLAKGLEGTFTRSVGENLTFIVVGQFDTGSNDKCLFEFNQGNNARGFFIDRRYASNTNYSPALTKGSFQLWRIEDAGGSAKVTEGGVTELISGPTYFNTDFTGVGSYTLGDDATGGNRMNGFIGEFLIFDRALTPAEVSKLEKYLINKWGL
jgi:hypothetical protein